LKHYETNSTHLHSSRAFQQYQKCDKRHHGLGDLNMANKTNKQPFFIDRSLRLVFMANFVLWTLNYLVVPFGFMDGFVVCAILFFKGLDFGLIEFNEKVH
jgi:hypothetical protein